MSCLKPCLNKVSKQGMLFERNFTSSRYITNALKTDTGDHFILLLLVNKRCKRRKTVFKRQYLNCSLVGATSNMKRGKREGAQGH